MRILDRYLLTQFVQVFIICFLSFVGLFVVIDAFQHLDRFIDFADTHGSLLGVMGEYYAYRALDIFDRMSGVLALIAAMFAITWLQRHNEMTALEAAGISKLRIVRPILITAVSVSLFAAANRELIIPNCREQLARDARDLAGQKQHPVVPCLDHETDIYLGGLQLSMADRRIAGPSFDLPPTLRKHGSKLVAKEAFSLPATSNHPRGYLLRGVTAPSQPAECLSLSVPSLSGNEQIIIFMPCDQRWLKGDECFVASNVEFQTLTGNMAGQRYTSIAGLIRGLHNPSNDFGADRRVAVHTRLIQPLMDATLLLLGVPIVLSQNNRNLFMAIGLCLAIVVAFMMVAIACQYLGNTSLISSALAAWLPLIIFVPVAVALAEPLRR